MALLHSTLLYITLPCLTFTLLYNVHYSTMALLHSTFSLHYSTMALLHSTLPYITLPWLYFSLLYPILIYHGSTLLYFTLHYPTTALLHSTLYSTLPYNGSTSLYLTLHYSVYITLPWLFFTLHDSALLYHGSTSLYMILQCSTMALLHITWPYITLPWFHFILLYSKLLYCGSLSLYFTLHYPTMALLHSTLLYITLPWLYFTLLCSTLLYYGYGFTLSCFTVDLLHSNFLKWWALSRTVVRRTWCASQVRGKFTSLQMAIKLKLTKTSGNYRNLNRKRGMF